VAEVDIDKPRLTHLRTLEAESIHILREAVAEFENPVMLYSIGKDSSVMLRLAQRAFAPAPLPFPLLHIDTTWKFREMIAHRDRVAREIGAELIVYTNADGLAKNINPFDHGSNKYTTVMKTDALKQALTKYKFDCAFGGARRDEERSRAKERVYSFRDRFHQWDPKNQRPELWSLYNARINLGESVRVFPLSNWTELDVWLYLWTENIPIVPLYLAKARPVVSRAGTLIMVDDDRMRLEPGEKPVERVVRFRTLGCYPLSGAIESNATTVPEVIQEMLLTAVSERQGRLIDHDEDASMEKKSSSSCPTSRRICVDTRTRSSSASSRSAPSMTASRRSSGACSTTPARYTKTSSRPCVRRHTWQGRTSTCRFSPMVWRPNASRASRSMSPTGTSARTSESSSSPTRRDTFSTRATW
jgi:sulfate adenylyltransferase subunit 2